MQPSDHRRLLAVLLILGLIFPTLLTQVYFVALGHSPALVQQVAWLAGKTIQFTLPLVGLLLGRSCMLGKGSRSLCASRTLTPALPQRGMESDRALSQRPPSEREPDQALSQRTQREPDSASSQKADLSRRARRFRFVAWGVAFGLVVFVAMLLAYHAWFKPGGFLGAAADEIAAKVGRFGIQGLGPFIVLGCFYSVVHSFLEEYYWRWFVFGQLRQFIPWKAAIAVSSLAFMGHHVLVLAIYFGWGSVWTWLFSMAVAVGGAFWAWLYHQSDSLWGPWISHLLVDAAIFTVGYDLIRSAA